MLGQLMRRKKKLLVAPTFVAAANAGSNFDGTQLLNYINIAKPAGVAVGDLLLAYIVYADPNRTVTPPTGWTQEIGTISGQLYSHTVAGGDPASWQWTSSVSGNWFAGIIAAYRGGIISEKAFVNCASPNPYVGDVGPSITTAEDNERVVHFWAFQEGNGTNAQQWVVPTAGTTLRNEWRTSGANPSGAPMTCADEVKTTAGAVGTRTATRGDTAVTGNWAYNPITIGLKGT